MQTILSWLTGAVALGVNVHALVALVRGMRERDVATIARYARRCGWSVAGLVAVVGAGLAVSTFANGAPADERPEDHAARLASTVAMAINGVGFTVVGVLLPSVAALMLRRRAGGVGAP